MPIFLSTIIFAHFDKRYDDSIRFKWQGQYFNCSIW